MTIRVLGLAVAMAACAVAQTQTPAKKDAPTPSGLVASEVLAKALPSLETSGKLGWVEFRADWCGWCKRMEKLFAEGEPAAVLRKYYNLIEIDWDRDAGAHELGAKLGEKGSEGLPWFAIIDAKGTVLIDSDGPKGNIGFPGNDEERAQFSKILTATAKGMTPDELAVVAKAVLASTAK